MKTRFRFITYRDQGDGKDLRADLFDAIAAACPAVHQPGGHRDVLNGNLLADDPRAGIILETLRAHGGVPWDGSHYPLRSDELSIILMREYTTKEIQAAKALVFLPSSQFDAEKDRDDAGRLRVPTSKLSLKSRLAISGDAELLVSTDIKTSMEAAGLRGLVFREVVFEGPKKAVESRNGQFWELDTELILPPMAPRMRFFHAVSGAEVERTAPPPFVIREGAGFPDRIVQPAEFHYEERAWSNLPPFDLARTLERPMGLGLPIFSPALYRLCVAQKISASWVPVRIGG